MVVRTVLLLLVAAAATDAFGVIVRTRKPTTQRTHKPTGAGGKGAPGSARFKPCTDMAFSDAYGDCKKYVANRWCSKNGTVGKGWKQAWGALGEKPKMACCGCGGGVKHTRPVKAPAAAAGCRGRHAFEEVAYHACFWANYTEHRDWKMHWWTNNTLRAAPSHCLKARARAFTTFD